MSDSASPLAASKNYWEDAALNLAATTPKSGQSAVYEGYVRALQQDLITLGYLKPKSADGKFGTGTARAVRRFQQHATQPYYSANGQLIRGGRSGVVTGVCDSATANQIRSWIDNGYRLPFNYYKIVVIEGGKLREDAAKHWLEAVAEIQQLGGLLWPEKAEKNKYYSDTWRNPDGGYKTSGSGNSRTSVHYTGRAVDINRDLSWGKHRRWWIAREDTDKQTYWRIYCKTTLQDGTQGVQFAAKTQKVYDISDGKESWLPAGYYLDLTEILAKHKFNRIKAQKKWAAGSDEYSEWWHFNCEPAFQGTFLDELEAIGYTEELLLRRGWTEAELDSIAQ